MVRGVRERKEEAKNRKNNYKKKRDQKKKINVPTQKK
jgi:hypothetical protein